MKRKRSRPDPAFTTLLIWRIPRRLKIRFKARCAKRRTSMRNEVIKMMSNF